MPEHAGSRIGVVAIGRNEGDRLKLCLSSLADSRAPIVYVDSGSTDGSREAARALGATVQPLDMARPFTAARARAEGFDRLAALARELDYVMFVDGDCEVEPGWLDEAVRFLDEHPGHAVVCGRRRERFPRASLYNRLMDAEWNTPVGDAAACGGDAVFRVRAYREAGGYEPAMVAHEEPELCSRIRRRGWRIARTDIPMTIHDADIRRLAPYLKRAVRAGYGYAQALARIEPKRGSNELQLVRRAVQWPVLACLALALAVLSPILGAVAITPLALSFLRDAWRSPPDLGALRFASLRLASKFAECLGILRWSRDRLLSRSSGAILYK